MGRSAPGGNFRDDAVDLVETVEGILSGRCIVLDRFDANGRRYLLVARCSDARAHSRALSQREAQVILQAIRGESHKRIAYELGLSRSSVTKLLRSALGKLCLRSQAQLVAEFSCFAQLAQSMDRDSLASPVALTACRKGRAEP